MATEEVLNATISDDVETLSSLYDQYEKEGNIFFVDLKVTARAYAFHSLKFLLSKGFKDDNGETFWWGCREGNKLILEILLEHDEKFAVDCFFKSSDFQSPAIFEAVHNSEIVKLFLWKAKNHPQFKTFQQSMLLKCALDKNCRETARLLSNAGFTMTEEEKAMLLKSRKNSTLFSQFQYFCTASGLTSSPKGCTGETNQLNLRDAVEVGALERVKELGKSLTFHEKDDEFYLEITRDLTMFKTLLEIGVDNSSMVSGSPLHQACYHSSQKIALYILDELKININVFSKSGWTPLMYAAAAPWDNASMVKLLLDRGADRMILSPGGYSALDNALKIGNIACAELLSDCPLSLTTLEDPPLRIPDQRLPGAKTMFKKIMTLKKKE